MSIVSLFLLLLLCFANSHHNFQLLLRLLLLPLLILCLFVNLIQHMFFWVFSVGADVRRQYSMEEEDDLLQFAIQQSLIDAGTEREEVSSLISFKRVMLTIRCFL